MSATAERAEIAVVKSAIGSGLIKTKEDRGDLFLCVQRDRIVDAITALKNDANLQYDYFVECLGVDYSRWTHARDVEGRFEVVYNLMSSRTYQRVFVKLGVDDGQKVPTLKHVFLGAEYPEKEIGDLYGIVFEGNELAADERFLLPDDWKGFPLRKEYPLGGEDVLFDRGDRGPAVEDLMAPHAGESFEGKTGSEDVSGR